MFLQVRYTWKSVQTFNKGLGTGQYAMTWTKPHLQIFFFNSLVKHLIYAVLKNIVITLRPTVLCFKETGQSQGKNHYHPMIFSVCVKH